MRSKRPGAATAAGVMSIIFGVVILLVGVCGGVSLVVEAIEGQGPFAGPGDPNAFLQNNVPGYTIYKMVGAVLRLLAGVSFLVAGIGIVNLRPWARATAIGWCVLYLLLTVGNLVYHFALVSPATRRFVRELLAPQMGPAGGGLGFLSGFQDALVAVISLLFVVYLIVILCLLLQGHVAAAFALSGTRDFSRDASEYDDYDDYEPRRRHARYEDS